ADKSCPLRIAPINRDLRDMVDFVDLFPFLNHEDACLRARTGRQRTQSKYFMSGGLNAGHT
ncbi:MAG: hypothetical protein ACQEQO_02495, partial [Thermodesulfobacteriota bacterium]